MKVNENLLNFILNNENIIIQKVFGITKEGCDKNIVLLDELKNVIKQMKDKVEQNKE